METSAFKKTAFQKTAFKRTAFKETAFKTTAFKKTAIKAAAGMQSDASDSRHLVRSCLGFFGCSFLVKHCHPHFPAAADSHQQVLSKTGDDVLAISGVAGSLCYAWCCEQCCKQCCEQRCG